MGPVDGFEIVLLTGFLGSGKTTLLKHFLADQAAADLGVVVNEIGEVDVDGAVLAPSAGKVPLALLSNGCICCAADGDLAGTVAMLQEERARRGLRPLRRVIVETSGAARPGPVLRGLRLLGDRAKTACVSTFDARDWRRALRTPEGRSQLGGASRIVVTKLDGLADGDRRAAEAAARAANPLAQVIVADDAPQRARGAFSAPAGPPTTVALPADLSGPAPPPMTTGVVRFPQALRYDELMEWLDNAAGLLGERLYRTKGFVRVRGAPDRLLVQGVGTTFAQPVRFPAPGRESFIVLIGEQLERAELEAVEPLVRRDIAVGRRTSALGRALRETLA
ncbi:MAG: GTP-binding protein [Rubrivivax sp.]